LILVEESCHNLKPGVTGAPLDFSRTNRRDSESLSPELLTSTSAASKKFYDVTARFHTCVAVPSEVCNDSIQAYLRSPVSYFAK
jgi:hypothetical protein